jgi:hypothetical protein
MEDGLAENFVFLGQGFGFGNFGQSWNTIG